MTRRPNIDDRLAAIAERLPKPEASPLPPGCEWVSWATTEELLLITAIAGAEEKNWPTGEADRELGYCRWVEVEAAAKRRQAEGWPSANDDLDGRYNALDRARQHEVLNAAERLRTGGTLTPPPPKGSI
jgi:hypothetical protein